MVEKRITKAERNYLRHRKSNLTELQKLVVARLGLDKEIRSVQKELRAWDNVLLNKD